MTIPIDYYVDECFNALRDIGTTNDGVSGSREDWIIEVKEAIREFVEQAVKDAMEGSR